MKFVIVDVQGYRDKNFIVKELCIFDGYIKNTYLFKPPFPYEDLSPTMRSEVNYMERCHHKIKFSSGLIPYNTLDEILTRDIIDNEVDIVYVKGDIKEKFLKNMLGINHNITIINLEKNLGEEESMPILKKSYRPPCLNHGNNKECFCAMENCIILYYWILSSLPK